MYKRQDRLRSSEDLVFWLTRVMERFTDLVFNLVDIKHKDIIYKAIDYMKCNYQLSLIHIFLPGPEGQAAAPVAPRSERG